MHTYSHMTANHNAEDAREQMRLYEEQGESFGDLFALLPNLPLNKVLEGLGFRLGLSLICP